MANESCDPVPAPSEPAKPGTRMVMCVKFGKELPGLDRVPWSGELGKRVYENVSKDAWKLWIEHSKEYPDTRAVLADASRTGKYFIGSINNEPFELNQYRIEAFNLRRDFLVFFSSCYVRSRKPEETIFRVALEVTQRPPEQCVFIDDRPLNLESPRRLGFTVIHHQNAEQLRSELRSYGVEV